jgi:hypothetical protein
MPFACPQTLIPSLLFKPPPRRVRKLKGPAFPSLMARGYLPLRGQMSEVGIQKWQVSVDSVEGHGIREGLCLTADAVCRGQRLKAPHVHRIINLLDQKRAFSA